MSIPMSSARSSDLSAFGRPVVAVLWKCDQLKGDIGRYPLTHLNQGFGRHQARVGSIDMAADEQQALRYGEIAVAQGTIDQRLLGQKRPQLAPERNALKQGAGHIHSRKPERQRCIHVEMRITEGRADEASGRIDLLTGICFQVFLDGGDPPTGKPDVKTLTAVGKIGVSNDQIEHGKPPGFSARRAGRVASAPEEHGPCAP